MFCEQNKRRHIAGQDTGLPRKLQFSHAQLINSIFFARDRVEAALGTDAPHEMISAHQVVELFGVEGLLQAIAHDIPTSEVGVLLLSRTLNAMESCLKHHVPSLKVEVVTDPVLLKTMFLSDPIKAQAFGIFSLILGARQLLEEGRHATAYRYAIMALGDHCVLDGYFNKTFWTKGYMTHALFKREKAAV